MAVAFKWSPEFETGIDIIDQQHRRIFDYLLEIETAISERSVEKVENVAKALIDYAISHNTFEEKLMEQAGYPMLEAHQKVHETFKIRALSYADRINQGEDPFAVAREVRGDIGLWLTNHIKRDDKHYVPFVKKSLDPSFTTRMLNKFFGRRTTAA